MDLRDSTKPKAHLTSHVSKHDRKLEGNKTKNAASTFTYLTRSEVARRGSAKKP